MAMKNKDYWTKRFELLEEAQLNKGVEFYHSLESEYMKAAKAVEKEIASWYSRYATENGITLSEAKKLLAGRDLSAFRMDVKEYIKKGQSLDPQWIKQLEQASVRVHISRLEALKVQMQQQVEALHGYEVDGLDKVARDIYTDGYYRTAFEIAKGSGVSSSLAALDTNKINKVISKPWVADGRNFSSRIWVNRSKLVDELHTLLTQNIIRGKAPDEVIKAISKRFEVSKHQAGRLVMTESAYFSSVAQKDSFNDVGVERYEVVATLDSRTSETCQGLDGKVFKMSEYEVGTTAPPFHQYCRSTTVPYFEDLGGDRASRNAEGKYETVPENMTYKDWKNGFVEEPVDNSLKGRINNIKANVNNKQKSISDIKSTLENKKQQINDIRNDVKDLQLEEANLKADIVKYDSIVDTDIDATLKTYQTNYDKLKVELDDLNTKSSRYYERPERGTPELKEWREWRKTVDMNDIFEKQVSLKQQMFDIERYITRNQELKTFKEGFDIKASENRLAAVQKSISSKRQLTNDVIDEMNKLEEDIKTIRLELNNEIKKAGKEFVSEVKKLDLNHSEELEKLRAENSRLYDKYYEASAIDKKAVHDEWTIVNQKMQTVRQQSVYDSANAIKAKLSEVREVGIGDKDYLHKIHLKNSKSQAVNSFIDAYDYYPREWVNSSIKEGVLSVKKTQRGYYSHHNSTIVTSGNDAASMFQTSIHELGHRFEKTVKDILDIEETYYNIRTKGDTLKWLGKGYSKSEKSRFDEFINPYMGKDYGKTAYELVSMGFELGYTRPAQLLKDEDMAEWIYGILTLL